MRSKLFWIYFSFLFSGTTIALVSSKHRKGRNWEGTLVFQDDFDGYEVQKDHWTSEDWCQGELTQSIK